MNSLSKKCLTFFLGWFYKKFLNVADVYEVTGFVSHIIQGTFALENPFGELIYGTWDFSGVLSGFKNAITHLGRVKAIEAGFPKEEFKERLNEIGSILAKNTDIAMKLKQIAKGLQREQTYSMALRCYNLAFAFVPYDNKGLHLELLRRRSILLLTMNDKDGALNDIERALDIDPHLRTTISVKAIRDEMTRDRQAAKMSANAERDFQVQKEYLENTLFKVNGDTYSANEGVSRYVAVRPDEGKGRSIFVTKELKCGTTVIVEDPFVTLIHDTLSWEVSHCSKCLKEVQATISCPTCVFVVYCSNKCLQTDYQDGHQYECSCMPYLHAIRAMSNIHLGLKAVCKAGPKILYELYLGSKFLSPRKQTLEVINGGKPTCEVIEAEPYDRILNLISHIRKTDDMETVSWIALSFAHILNDRTEFFHTAKDLNERNEFVQFVGSVLLHHFLAFMYNIRALYAEIKIKDIQAYLKRNRREDREIGSAVYSVTNLMNHSCSPNVIQLRLPNGRITIIINRNMSPGDELTDTYGLEFLGDKLDVRQSFLENYCFHCKCEACTHDWPTYRELVFDIEFVCSECSQLNSTEMANCVIVGNDVEGMCPECQKFFPLEELFESIFLHDRLLQEADGLILANRPTEAVEILQYCIEFFQKILCHPSKRLILAQGTLAEALEVIVRKSSS